MHVAEWRLEELVLATPTYRLAIDTIFLACLVKESISVRGLMQHSALAVIGGLLACMKDAPVSMRPLDSHESRDCCPQSAGDFLPRRAMMGP
ncbi:hypothetical protein CVIRNUC_006532 [Coccomyxa viridis]|uniref:Uncharacterized protein n=1 Tax=Coccomyxa viridis TaxID=1274662 RepID=A0AAV1I7K9_9CHLO|nr:hypothetical protein CVIRNUC_006532 [Coccomyxa viridis]